MQWNIVQPLKRMEYLHLIQHGDTVKMLCQVKEATKNIRKQTNGYQWGEGRGRGSMHYCAN